MVGGKDMLDELLEKKLKDLKDDDILVVMDDGLAFLGELVQFDKNTLILKDVYQAPAKQIDWKRMPSESDEVREQMDENREFGFIDWTHINLEEVYIRIDHVSRIWRWFKEKQKKEVKKEFRRAKRPVYSRIESVPEERQSSVGDIPDRFLG